MLVLVPLEADVETSLQIQVVSLKGGLRKPGRNVWLTESRNQDPGVKPQKTVD